MAWINNFRDRLEQFEHCNKAEDGEILISIKVRADNGCYSRGCCPFAFRQIEVKLRELERTENRFVFEEHESGPEIIAYVKAGLDFVKSIIDLVTTVIKARSEGLKHGDKHHEPVTLVVRRLEKPNLLMEERVLTFDPKDEVTAEIVRQALVEGCKKITKKPAKRTRTKSAKSSKT